MKAVFASRNRHKARQVERLLPDIDLVPLDEVAAGLSLSEPFDTFEENALAKARTVVEATGLPAVADDSGLEVEALSGGPGVRSARFAGPAATDEENNHKLVRELRNVPRDRLAARYVCVATIAFPKGTVLTAEGVCHGRIVLEPRGDLGFGYDPHFVPEGETRTMGEIGLEEKILFNHRGRAFRALAEKLAALPLS